jgi:hypothetical protein
MRCVVLLCLALALCVQAQKPPPFAPWESIHFTSPPSAGAKCILASYKDQKERWFADGHLWTRSTTTADKTTEYRMFFAELGEGQIVPADGVLYKVTRLDRGDKPEMIWTQLPRKEWPKGVETQPQPILVLVDRASRTTYTSLGFWTLILREINVPRDGKGKPSAVLRFRKTKPELVLEEATVSQGDILLIDGRGHRVRHIVPRDEKTGVFGWLELDPESVPEADLKRGKTPYVKPVSILKK